jgi:hypothetical protein
MVPLRTGNVTAKSGGVETLREGVSVTELTERIVSEMMGRDGMNRRHQDFQFSTSSDRIAYLLS